MDYTEFSNLVVKKCEASNINKEYLLREETLYYDETGNAKHLIVKEGKLNADIDLVFVLGGVQAESTIPLNELKTRMGKSQSTELKSTKDLNGSFIEVLRKDNLKKILDLINDKGWHIHFNAIQILFYGFVDIIDSIPELSFNPFEFKAVLYKVLRNNSQKTIEHFKKYKYPNIKDNQISDFLDGIICLMEDQMKADAKEGLMDIYLCVMKSLFEEAKEQKKLVFIQDNESHVWVNEFEHFYRNEIWSFTHKKLIFDEEKQVMSSLKKEPIEINGKVASNYKFINSANDAMIQVSDYVVSILRKYFVFLDRMQSEVEKDISEFDTIQMNNYSLLNSILKDSLNYNPLFFNITASAHTRAKFLKYMGMYG